MNWSRTSNGCNSDRNGLPDPITVPGVEPHTCPEQSTTNRIIMASLDWQLPGHVLSVSGGHSEFEYDISLDLDTSADAFLVSGIDENFEQDSVEIRLTSEKGGMLDYLVGAYYQQWENYNINPAQYGPATLGGLTQDYAPNSPNAKYIQVHSCEHELAERMRADRNMPKHDRHFGHAEVWTSPADQERAANNPRRQELFPLYIEDIENFADSHTGYLLAGKDHYVVNKEIYTSPLPKPGLETIINGNTPAK